MNALTEEPETTMSAIETLLPLVNVARIDTKLPNTVLIVRHPVHGNKLPNLKTLSPSTDLLHWWKGTRGSDTDWRTYERRYWIEIAERCRRPRTIWHGAKYLIAEGLETDMRGACLASIIRAAAKILVVSELTLCCFEPEDDEHCHRKLVYDALPPVMKGQRR